MDCSSWIFSICFFFDPNYSSDVSSLWFFHGLIKAELIILFISLDFRFFICQCSKIIAMQNALEFSDLSEHQRERVFKKLSKLEMVDSMNTYNGLVQRCFSQCVTSFRSKTLEKSEKTCVQNCVSKFMIYSGRVGQRFAEKNQQLNVAATTN